MSKEIEKPRISEDVKRELKNGEAAILIKLEGRIEKTILKITEVIIDYGPYHHMKRSRGLYSHTQTIKGHVIAHITEET